MRPFFLKILSLILRRLAKMTIRLYRPGIIGITGNVGKTSVKEAIKTVLSCDRKVRASSKNFNNELGLPLTILGDWQDTGGIFFWLKVVASAIFNVILKTKNYPEILILEYAVDKPGDMKKLLEIARPHIGIVTAIGEIPVHIEFFAGQEGIVREKSRLINNLPATGFAILNADDKAVLSMKEHTRAHLVTFGFNENVDVKISNFNTNFNKGLVSLSFKLNYGGSFVPVRLENMLGKTQAYAVAAAAATAIVFGINLVKISENLSSYKSPAGRLSPIPGIKNSLIIDDTYNASPLATQTAFMVLEELRAYRKIAVLGDMLELGKYTIEAHQAIGAIAAKTVKVLITVGTRAKFIAESALKYGLPKKSIFVFDNTAQAGKYLQEIINDRDVVLVKGSQAVRMEKIVEEVMREPEKAEKLLVRQNERWQKKKGIYE